MLFFIGSKVTSVLIWDMQTNAESESHKTVKKLLWKTFIWGTSVVKVGLKE